MKKLVSLVLSFALALSLLTPLTPTTDGKGVPPDDEPGDSICGDEWPPVRVE